MKIRAGDSVVITTGKDKGKTGKVLRVLEAKNRVVVTDVAIRTRHVKGGPNRPGEIVKYEASIALSNVMIIDPKTKKRSRVGFKKNEKGHKIRIAKISGEEIKKGTVAAKKETAAKDDGTKVKTVKSTAKKDAPADANDPKSPFWKKMGFGAEDLAGGADVEAKNEDHSVPEQTSSVNRSSQRGA
ncbi:50S ribosomal protein L24 [Candidatus Peregrinibacteria bacterium]|nr:50S ribosomal protein L24 [Candidatus Peregrinibacteria bacterium]MBT7337265.1 50S ribosomal protein L24 [Candidatus Peregrinibacteria bacterium]